MTRAKIIQVGHKEMSKSCGPKQSHYRKGTPKDLENSLNSIRHCGFMI